MKRFTLPGRGWIRALREAMGMSAAKLAKRMGVSAPRVFALEKAEARGAVTLASHASHPGLRAGSESAARPDAAA